MQLFIMMGKSRMTSSEWAAWVQAVGSVLAILAAGGIAIWQQHNIERARAKDSKRLQRIDDDLARDLAISVIDWYRNLNWQCKNVLSTWRDGLPATSQMGTDWALSPLDQLENGTEVVKCAIFIGSAA